MDQRITEHRLPTRAILAICCIAQFMVVLDVAIVNVALPQMRDSLGLSVAGQQWVVNAYTLTFAGFLMLGGRAADLFGRRRVFMVGLARLHGLQPDRRLGPERELAHRRPRGPGDRWRHPRPGHLEHLGDDLHRPQRAPAGPRRVVGHGGQRGRSRCAGRRGADQPPQLALGALRQRADRHRPDGRSVAGAAADRGARPEEGPRHPRGGHRHRRPGRPGLRHREHQRAPVGIGAGPSCTLAIGWSCWPSSSSTRPASPRDPLIPLGIFRRRSLSVANGIAVTIGAGLFGTYFFLSLYLQDVNGYSALRAGLAFLPAGLCTLAGALIGTRLVQVIGARRQLVLGPGLAAVACSGSPPSGPATPTSPMCSGPLILIGLGIGMSFVPMTLSATAGVPPHEAGLASGLINTTRQVGGALGLAIMATVATTVATHHLVGSHNVGGRSPPAIGRRSYRRRRALGRSLAGPGSPEVVCRHSEPPCGRSRGGARGGRRAPGRLRGLTLGEPVGRSPTWVRRLVARRR